MAKKPPLIFTSNSIPPGQRAFCVRLLYDKQPFDAKRYEAHVMVIEDDPTRAAHLAKRCMEEWLGKKDGEEYPKVVLGELTMDATVIHRDDYIKLWKDCRRFDPLTAWAHERMRGNPKYMPKAFWGMKRNSDGQLVKI